VLPFPHYNWISYLPRVPESVSSNSNNNIAVTVLRTSTKSPYVGPVSTGMGDCVWVQFPVPDISLGMWPATQVNSAWPSLRE